MKKRGVRMREVDEEDVVQSAFDSFCRRAKDGKFPKLEDRDNLWPLLLTITDRKAAKAARKQRAIKRGKVRGESALIGPDDQAGTLAEMAATPEPTPEMAAEFAEEVDRLLFSLDNESLRTVAIRKLEGFTTEEIARELGCSPRAVKQKAAMIRKIWEGEQQ
jgi:RNA polymerase sigma factor (sigma-70 family)